MSNFLKCDNCGESISGEENIKSMENKIKTFPYINYGTCDFCGGNWKLYGYAKVPNIRLQKAKKNGCKECIELASDENICGGKITCDKHWDGGSLENWSA